MKKSQRGYTIVELSVSVAIAGVLLVGSIALVQTVLNTSRANDTITSISRVVAQIDKIWSNTNSYAGLDIGSAGGAGVFEGMSVQRDLTNKVIGVTSKFNRPIKLTLNADLPTTGSNRGYTLSFSGIPTSVCADIVSAAANSGIRGIQIAAEAVAGTVPGGDATLGSLKLAADDTLSGGPTSNVVVVEPKNSSVNIANMTGTAGCGTPQNTVTIVLANWK